MSAGTSDNSIRNSFGGVRVTAEQRELMLAYMIKHPTLASGRMQTPQGGRLKKLMWEDLAKILNACPRGSQKSADRWCKSWQDWRLDAKQKACKLQRNSLRTGEDQGSVAAPLTSIEEKLIAFLEGNTVCVDERVMDTIESQSMERISPISFQIQEANKNNKTSVEEDRVAEEDPDRTHMSQEENFAESQKMRSPIRKVQSGHSQFTNQLPLIRRAFNRLEKMSNIPRGESEFEIFGRSIAAQLSQIPLADALELQLKIQTLVTQERLRLLKENS